MLRSSPSDLKPPLTIVVLLVCRNRRETTLAAIDRVKRQSGVVNVSIALFDDASTDGTPESVAEQYPEIQIVHGDGNAFWNGGLHRVWSHMKDAKANAFLWLNDDTLLDQDAFTQLSSAWNAIGCEDQRLILVGATRGQDEQVSYSGYDLDPTPFAFRLKRVLPDPSGLHPITTFNGNIVLVGRGTVSAIGLNDPAFFHNLGDIDYGLRARAAGIPVYLLPTTLGICEGNSAKQLRGFGSPLLGVIDQWRVVNTHHGLPFRSWWRFTRRHSGPWWPLHFAIPYRHLLRFWGRTRRLERIR